MLLSKKGKKRKKRQKRGREKKKGSGIRPVYTLVEERKAHTATPVSDSEKRRTGMRTINDYKSLKQTHTQ